MKKINFPEKIFLQTGIEEGPANVIDYKECSSDAITWCVDKCYESDIEYILMDKYKKLNDENETLIDILAKLLKVCGMTKKDMIRLKKIAKKL